MTVEILRIHELKKGYVLKTMLPEQDGLLVLTPPNSKTDTRNVKGRTECLFEVFLHVCEEERWHVLQNPLGPPLIISLARRRKTNRFPRSLTRQINY